jgi:hypothetical protein
LLGGSISSWKTCCNDASRTAAGHLDQLYRMSGYFKKYPKHKFAFDAMQPKINERIFKKHDWHKFYRGITEAIPYNMPVPRGNAMSTHCFVDVSHGSDRATMRRSQTGILIFCNKAPMILWHSKRQNTVKVSTFGSEFQAMKNTVELVEALCRYKLPMFGVPIDGPTNLLQQRGSLQQEYFVARVHILEKEASFHCIPPVSGGGCSRYCSGGQRRYENEPCGLVYKGF